MRHERGRSIIEIIAVLIIVGILSVGIMWTVAYLLAKNTANSIQKKANERAASIMTSPSLAQAEVGNPLDALGFSEKEEGFAYEQKKVTEDAFSVFVKPVKKRVCEILMGMDLSYLKDFRVNDETYSKATCLEAENTVEFVYAAGKLHRAKPLESCGAGSNACGFGCCPKGKACCQGECVDACSGFGMTGERDTFTCECICDVTKGFKKATDSTSCVCEENYHYEDGHCVCDDTRCEGGVLNSSCECNCGLNGLKPKDGDPRKCVKCNNDGDCSSASCEKCENNVCVGKCCVENGGKCTPGDNNCCDIAVCPEAGYCCIDGLTQQCNENKDCCNGTCTDHHCCAGLQKSCLAGSDCCDAHCVNAVCCRLTGEVCTEPQDCCKYGEGNISCSVVSEGTDKVCCIKLGKKTCDKDTPCCEGTCTSGLCCLEEEEKCKTDSDCCSGFCDPKTKTCQAKCITKFSKCTEEDECCENLECGVKNICCPKNGYCENHCGECCPYVGVPECEWREDKETGWKGICSNVSGSNTGFYGKEAKDSAVRCCKNGEALVPGFSGYPGGYTKEGNAVRKLNTSYCCPVEDGKMEYTYFNEEENACKELGECPSSYDGIALVIDLSYSMFGEASRPANRNDGGFYLHGLSEVCFSNPPDSRKGKYPFEECPYMYLSPCTDGERCQKPGTPEKYRLIPLKESRNGVLIEQLKGVFNDKEIPWEELKVGIYTFGNDSQVVLPYKTHSLDALKDAIENKVIADYCNSGKPCAQTCTAMGLEEAKNNTAFGKNAVSEGTRNIPIFFILTDGAEYCPTNQNKVLKDIVGNMENVCDNLFDLHIFGFGDIKSAAQFGLGGVAADNIHPISLSTPGNLKAEILKVAKRNFANCIPRSQEDQEACCQKGKKWDDKKKQCTK